MVHMTESALCIMGDCVCVCVPIPMTLLHISAYACVRLLSTHLCVCRRAGVTVCVLGMWKFMPNSMDVGICTFVMGVYVNQRV